MSVSADIAVSSVKVAIKMFSVVGMSCIDEMKEGTKNASVWNLMVSHVEYISSNWSWKCFGDTILRGGNLVR